MEYTYTHVLTQAQLDAARERLTKLQRAAQKLGTVPIQLHVSEPRVVVSDMRAHVEYDVALTGSEPVIRGYKFVGVVNHENAGNVIKLAANARDEFDTKPYRTGAQKCDHCGMVRNRKDTYLVVHLETATLKQVGSSCLRDFVGHGDPNMIMAYVTAALDFVQELNDEDSFGYARDGSYGEPMMDTLYFMSHVCAMVDTYGWVSKARAQECGDPYSATTVRALDNISLTESSNAEDREAATPVHDAHKQTAVAALAWCANEIATKPVDARSDYEHNLVVACGNGVAFELRQAGIVGSLISAYRRATAQQAEQRAAAVQSNHYGQPGWKLANHNMIVTRVFDNDTQYGVSYKHIMRDDRGNVFTWQSSTYRLFENTRYSISGTVKAHTEYKGIKQTQLTRCKFVEVED